MVYCAYTMLRVGNTYTGRSLLSAHRAPLFHLEFMAREMYAEFQGTTCVYHENAPTTVPLPFFPVPTLLLVCYPFRQCFGALSIRVTKMKNNLRAYKAENLLERTCKSRGAEALLVRVHAYK